MTEDAAATAERLVGAWDLVEWFEVREDGSKVFPLGEHARGQIIYTADGHVAAQLAAGHRTRFRSDDWREASVQEAAHAFKEYFGYFGTFSIDVTRGAVTHHVNGGWFPNVEGCDQVRFLKFEDDRLVLDAGTAWGKVRIIWARATDALPKSHTRGI